MNDRTFQPIYIHNPAFTVEETKRKNPNKWIIVGILFFVIITMLCLLVDWEKKVQSLGTVYTSPNHVPEPNESSYLDNHNDADDYEREASSESNEDESSVNELRTTDQAPINIIAEMQTSIDSAIQASVNSPDRIHDAEIINESSVANIHDEDEEYDITEHYE